jgi:hypothetical protein
MKNKLNQLVFLSSTILLLFNCACTSIEGTGPLVSQKRNTNEFSGVTLDISANVYLIHGDTPTVMLRAQQNIADEIITEMDGSNLVIKTKNSISTNEPIEVWLTLKTIEEVELNGSGSISSSSTFKCEKTRIDISGSGKISLALMNEKLDVTLDGSGDLNLSGKVTTAELEISGSGNILASECYIDDCDVTVSGSGMAKLHVSEKLTSTINGSGSVHYSGNPQKTKSEISGSGQLIKED